MLFFFFSPLFFQTKGELSNERKENYEAAIINYQKLQQNTHTLAVSYNLLKI